jgi:hypothetical protein
MPDTSIDEVLLALRDAGLANADRTGVDASCRARLRGEIEREHRGRRARRSRWGSTARFRTAARFAAAIGAAITIAGGAYAVPATRAAVDDVYGALSNWVSGDAGSAPGRPVVSTEDVPSWVATENGQKRVLAAADGQKLFAIRQGDKVTFALADFGTTATIEGWRTSIDGQKIVQIGPGQFLPNGRHDLRPLFGLVAASVKRIQFNYADGGPPVSQAGLDGAFAVTIEAGRRPGSLTGYDETDHLIARVAYSSDPRMPGYADFRYCPGAAGGCPPWAK